MNILNAMLGKINAFIGQVQGVEITISYLTILILCFVILLGILFNSKRALATISLAIVVYFGAIKGYGFIASSLDAQPLLWIVYLVVGIIFILAFGLSMFLDR